MIIGKIPNRPFPACQVRPSKNLPKPIFAIAGTPFANRKIQINATASIETQAQSIKTNSIPFSFTFCSVISILIPFPAHKSVVGCLHTLSMCRYTCQDSLFHICPVCCCTCVNVLNSIGGNIL